MAGNPFDLNQVRVASPCNASWDAMDGDERARFCGQCQKHVYNLSAMSQREAEELIVEKEGHLCVRFYQRSDGTMLTANCPVGLRAWRRKIAGWTAAAAAAVATFVTIGGVFARGTSGNGPLQSFTSWVDPAPTPPTTPPAMVMGEMVCPPAQVAPPPQAIPPQALTKPATNDGEPVAQPPMEEARPSLRETSR